MKKLMAIMLLFFSVNCMLFSQTERTVFGKSGFRISGAWGGPAMGVGQLNDAPMVFRGGFGGVEFGKRLFIGWAGFESDNDVYIDALDNNQFKMDYSGLMFGFTPSAHKTIHPHIMVLTGTGNARMEDEESNNMVIVQPTVGFEINVFRFFHLAFDGGYRFITNVNLPGLTANDLSGPYGEIKMKFGFSW